MERLTQHDIDTHRTVVFVREVPRPGYSYRARTTTTLLERDYWKLLRPRPELRANRFGMLGGSAFRNGGHSTIQHDELGATGMRHITVNDTSATAHTLPKNAMHLTRVSPMGGAALGSLIINYAANSYAHFSVPITSIGDYDVDWPITGNALASGIFTTDGTAPASWSLTFAEGSWGGPHINDYLAIRTAVTAGGAVTTITNLTAVAFDVGEAVPTAIQAYAATAAIPATLFFPGEPGFQGGANCQDTTKGVFPAPFTRAPKVSPGNNITMAYLAAGAGVVTGYVFYRPTAGYGK